MTDEEALEEARLVNAGKSRSYVQAARVLAKFVVAKFASDQSVPAIAGQTPPTPDAQVAGDPAMARIVDVMTEDAWNASQFPPGRDAYGRPMTYREAMESGPCSADAPTCTHEPKCVTRSFHDQLVTASASPAVTVEAFRLGYRLKIRDVWAGTIGVNKDEATALLDALLAAGVRGSASALPPIDPNTVRGTREEWVASAQREQVLRFEAEAALVGMRGERDIAWKAHDDLEASLATGSVQHAWADGWKCALDKAEGECRELAKGWAAQGEHKRESAATECADRIVGLFAGDCASPAREPCPLCLDEYGAHHPRASCAGGPGDDASPAKPQVVLGRSTPTPGEPGWATIKVTTLRQLLREVLHCAGLPKTTRDLATGMLLGLDYQHPETPTKEKE